MDAAVFRERGQYFISLRYEGLVIEVAGPFDCELEATMAARRAVYGGGELITLQAAPAPVVLKARTDGLF